MTDAEIAASVRAAILELLPDLLATFQFDGWLTKHEAAAYLRMSASNLERLMSSDSVPFHAERRGRKGRRGSSPLFRKSELDEWLLRNGHAPIATDMDAIVARGKERFARKEGKQ